MIVTLSDYWMGRDRLFATSMSPDLEHRAVRMVALTNELLRRARAAGVSIPVNPRTENHVSSGWRPPSINANTPNAAPNSKHMTGDAIDLYDPDGDLDDWLMSDAGQAAMVEVGLWHEHPSATKGWAHLQSLPPRSGRRTFYP